MENLENVHRFDAVDVTLWKVFMQALEIQMELAVLNRHFDISIPTFQSVAFQQGLMLQDEVSAYHLTSVLVVARQPVLVKYELLQLLHPLLDQKTNHNHFVSRKCK